jgi:hypothetical protein
VRQFVKRQEKLSRAHLGSLPPEELERLHPGLGEKLGEASKKERIEQAKQKRKETSTTKRKARSRREREPRKKRGYPRTYDEATRQYLEEERDLLAL